MMRRGQLALAAAVIATTLALAPAAGAQVVEPYSGGAVSPTSTTSVLPKTLEAPTVAEREGVVADRQGAAPTQGRSGPTSLPFTGGELLLVTLLALAALAAGTVLVGVGRRRVDARAR